MSILSKVDSFSTGTGAAASTVVVTGVGFQPKAIIFWLSGRSESTDAIGRAAHYRGFGVATSPTSRFALANNVVDAAGTSDTQKAQDAASCIVSVSTGAAIDGQIDLQSMDADGFTLVVDDQMPRDMRVHYLALGGDSITDVATGSFQEPTVTGDQDITSLSFQPDCVLFASIDLTTAPPATSGHSHLMIGAATGSSNQGVSSTVDATGQATIIAKSYCISTECIALFNNASSVNARASFSTFLSNGFRINWATRNTTRYVFFLALKGGNYRVDSLLTRTDGNDIAETGFGFQPSSALFVSHGQAESTSPTPQANDQLSIGAFSSLTNRGAQATLSEDNLADSEVTTAIEFDAVYANIAADSTLAGLMDVKSIDADGFTMVMDDADPGAAFVWYTAFGPAEVPSATHILDATLLKTQSATHVLDSTLLKTQSATHILDTTLLKTTTADHILDTTLLKTTTADYILDSILLKTQTATYSLDGSLFILRTADHILDSTLLKTQSATYSLDADLQGPVPATSTINLIGTVALDMALSGKVRSREGLVGTI